MLLRRREVPHRTESYMRSIALLGRYKPLNKDEEIELFRRHKAGDTRASEKIVLHNMRIAILAAQNYATTTTLPEDLISAAYMGLIRAVEGFDPERNVRFTSYAINWIRKHLIDTTNAFKSQIHIPLIKITEINKARRICDGRVLYGEITDNHADHLISSLAPRTCNLVDAKRRDGSQAEVALRDTAADEYNEMGENEGRILSALDTMTSQEKMIIQHYYGIGGAEYLNLREIGEKLGLCKEHIRQIKQQAINRLRKKLNRF